MARRSGLGMIVETTLIEITGESKDDSGHLKQPRAPNARSASMLHLRSPVSSVFNSAFPW